MCCAACSVCACQSEYKCDVCVSMWQQSRTIQACTMFPSLSVSFSRFGWVCQICIMAEQARCINRVSPRAARDIHRLSPHARGSHNCHRAGQCGIRRNVHSDTLFVAGRIHNRNCITILRTLRTLLSQSLLGLRLRCLGGLRPPSSSRLSHRLLVSLAISSPCNNAIRPH